MNQIKKIILTLGLMLSVNLWASPMDDTCTVLLDTDKGFIEQFHIDKIKNKCERNNILEINNLLPYFVTGAISYYCRFDREIFTQEGVVRIGINPKEVFDLTCVLYSNVARNYR